jgi:hypothetical protein
MINYAPPAIRHRLAQEVVPVSGSPIVSPAVEGALWTALAASAAWAAIATGRREKGFKSVAAWAGGIASGVAALVGVTNILAPTVARTFPVRLNWMA